MENETKVHLGDGAYAEYDGFSTLITAENGMEATDTVYLEPQCIEALVRWMGQHYDKETLIRFIEGHYP